jgi:hypothetical protein
MEIIYLLLAVVVGVLSIGCSLTTAYEVAVGKMKFPGNVSFWGAMVFHASTALLTLWLVGIWLGK